MAETITLIAVERGFHKGRMVEPGAPFPFDPVGADGKHRKLPKWAAKEGDQRLGKTKAKPVADLRPPEAQAAAKAKAAAVSEGVR